MENENLEKKEIEDIENKNEIVPTQNDKQITYGKVSVSEKSTHSGLRGFLGGILGGVVGVIAVLAIVVNVPQIKDNFTINNDDTENTDTPSTIIKNMVEYQNPVPAVSSQVGPSVVGVTVEYTYNSFFGTQRVVQEGSGIIISTDGYILTNNHVLSTNNNAIEKKAKVYLPNSSEPLDATIVGTDAQTDIGVLKVDCTDLPAVTIGSSNDLEVGAMVIAIGNPLGRQFEGSVTVGYVSALNRQVSDTAGNTYTLIQTDAAINEGNSGGALVNTNGELVGINMAKIEGTGIEGLGFAIPIDDVKTVIDDLIEYKKVIRPSIGYEGINVNEATKNRYNLDSVGVYIKAINPFSAAEIAGLKVGDIIIKFDGQTIESMEQLNTQLQKHEVGDTVELVIMRNGKEMNIEVTLKEE